jgi:predicted nucleotidyltransferase component of viral defense system
MLHYSTIDKSTLELLKRLMALPLFSNLVLCGGTSLALQIGHRKSIDIDLFGVIEVDEISISRILSEQGKTQIIKKTPSILIYTVDGVKVDIVNYQYPWIQGAISEDSIRLASIQDIAAMKLAAITGRGSKKDFIDIYFLLQHYSISQMLNLYNQKYKDGSSFMVLKSLTYFDDAEADPEPFMLTPINWDQIKNAILRQVDTYL